MMTIPSPVVTKIQCYVQYVIFFALSLHPHHFPGWQEHLRRDSPGKCCSGDSERKRDNFDTLHTWIVAR